MMNVPVKYVPYIEALSKVATDNFYRFSDRLKASSRYHFDVEPGNKYLKLVYWVTQGNNEDADRHVFGFIVTQDEEKFKEGDFLKAASWAAPSKNFSRGNLFDMTTWNFRYTGF